MRKSKEDSLSVKLDFYDILTQNTKDYQGHYEFVIKKAPEIYQLLCNLLKSESITKETRRKIACAIAYFILPEDVYPECTLGPIGYIDDILLCVHVLREIRSEYNIDILLEHWQGDYNILTTILDEYYTKIIKDCPNFLKKMLELVGLQ